MDAVQQKIDSVTAQIEKFIGNGIDPNSPFIINLSMYLIEVQKEKNILLSKEGKSFTLLLLI